MHLYGLKTCDTCRKALKSLPDANLVDVRAEGVPEDVLDAALQRFDADLVNMRSTTWRGLDADERARPAKELLMRYPTLMKRPLIVDADKMYLGWSKETQAALG